MGPPRSFGCHDDTLTERARSGTLDAIEEAGERHDHIPEPVAGGDASAPKRVKIMLPDLVKYGFSKQCPTGCQHEQEDHERARHLSHSESRRRRSYGCLLADGASKKRKVDPAWVKTTAASSLSAPSSSSSTPKDLKPNADLLSSQPNTAPNDSDPNLDSPVGADDSDKHYRDPDAMFKDIKNGPAISQVISEVSEGDRAREMVALMNVLQTLGQCVTCKWIRRSHCPRRGTTLKEHK